MAERTTITQRTQIGAETTAGTEVAATKVLQALSVEPGIKADIETFAPSGAKYTTIAALGKEWVEASIAGHVACYNHMAYLLSGGLCYAAPVKQGTTKAYKWTLALQQSAEDTIKTFTVEQGSSARAGKFAYGLISDFSIKFSREAMSVDGNMLGQAYQDGVSLTSAGVTAVPVMPILPTVLDVYIDDSSASLGTTKLTRAFSGELSIGGRFAPVWTINSAIDGFAAHAETKPTAQFKLLVEADAAGMGTLLAMRSGSRRYIRLKAEGPVIEETHNYLFQIDVCGIVTDVGPFADEDGVYAIEWTFDAAYDSAWGKVIEAILINELAGL